jgi:hypothetical protein
MKAPLRGMGHGIDVRGRRGRRASLCRRPAGEGRGEAVVA